MFILNEECELVDCLQERETSVEDYEPWNWFNMAERMFPHSSNFMSNQSAVSWTKTSEIPNFPCRTGYS